MVQKSKNQKGDKAKVAKSKVLAKSKQLKNTGALNKKVGGKAQNTCASIFIASCTNP